MNFSNKVLYNEFKQIGTNYADKKRFRNMIRACRD